MLNNFTVGFNLGLKWPIIIIPDHMPQLMRYDLLAGFNAAKFRMSLPEGWLE